MLTVVPLRVSAFVQHADDDSLSRANGVPRVADEPDLGLAPLVEVALAGHRRQVAELELLAFALDHVELRLTGAQTPVGDGPLVLGAEPLLEMRATPPDPDEGEDEEKRHRDRHWEHDPFPRIHPCCLLGEIETGIPRYEPRETPACGLI